MDIAFTLITGFLGAGKTTFLNRLLSERTGERTGVIVNEFGQINIDGRLIHQDEAMEITEITNGSIFCTCRAPELIEALVKMADTGIDRVIVEATGFADPSNLFNLLPQANASAKRKYRYRGTVCLVDGVHILKLIEALPVLERQIAFSELLILNKRDLIGDRQAAEIREKLSAIAPTAVIREASYGRADLPETAEYAIKAVADSLNTPGKRPHTEVAVLPPNLTKAEMEQTVNELRAKAYRIKGFATIDGERRYIDIVGDLYTETPVDMPGVENQLILMFLP